MYASPIPRCGVSVNTGSPAAPSARYSATARPARRQPSARPSASTTNGCIVIGTGQNGTLIFADAHSSSEPAMANPSVAAIDCGPDPAITDG